MGAPPLRALERQEPGLEQLGGGLSEPEERAADYTCGVLPFSQRYVQVMAERRPYPSDLSDEHIVIDTLGPLLAVAVTAASVQEYRHPPDRPGRRPCHAAQGMGGRRLPPPPRRTRRRLRHRHGNRETPAAEQRVAFLPRHWTVE